MRRLFAHLFLLTMLVGAAFVAPQPAHAQGFVDGALSLLTGGTDLFYGLIGKIFWWVLIPLASVVFQLLGLVIDSAIELSLTSSFYNASAIGLAWSIVRDICNMVFIFVLIYEGIRTILNIGNSATVKRTITSVIIAAVLLNFSLFFTKAVIDVSNVASTWFIQGIENMGGDGASVSNSIRATLRMDNLAKASGRLGESTMASFETLSLEAFTQGVLLFVLTCVAIYVFFNVVFLVVGRIVAFIYLLIMSPLGFVGLFVDIPQIKDYGKEWRDELMAQAVMLPLFFLMVYITLFIVDRVDALVFGTTTQNAAGQEFTPVNYVIFIIIIMMLLRALKTAQKYSGEIGGMFAGAIKSATTFVSGAALMGTVGRAATWAKDNKAFQAAASRSGMADLALKGTAKVADSGFGLKSGYSGVAKIAGLDKVGITKDAFKGAESYSKQRKAEAEAEKKAVDRFGKGAEGEANRLAYASRRGNEWYNKVTGAKIPGTNISLTGSQANIKKAMEDVAKKAGEEYTKEAKSKAKGDANSKQNQLVMAETAQKLMDKSLQSADPQVVAAAAATSQALIGELKGELEKGNEDTYLQFVRGYATFGATHAQKLEDEKKAAAAEAKASEDAEKTAQNEAVEAERAVADARQAVMKAEADKGKSGVAAEAAKANVGRIEAEISELRKSKNLSTDSHMSAQIDEQIKAKEAEAAAIKASAASTEDAAAAIEMAKKALKESEERLAAAKNKAEAAQKDADRAQKTLADKEASIQAYAKAGSEITAEDREKAAKKFVEPTDAGKWSKTAAEHVTHASQVAEHIELAEKALAEANKKDADAAQRRSALEKARKHVKDLVGDKPEYRKEKSPDGKEKKGKSRVVEGTGSGLRYKAAKAKQDFNDKDNDLSIKDGGDKDDEEEDKKAEGGGEKKAGE